MGSCGNTWGEQEPTLFIADRTGRPIFPITTWQSIVGGPFRIVDSVSNLIIVAEDNKWHNLHERIDPWRHELQLYACPCGADGRSDSGLIWSGPIQRVTLTDDPQGQRVTISAQDMLGWLAVRLLEGKIRTDEIATHFSLTIQEAMALDDVGLATNPQLISVEGTRRITNLATALAEARELGRDGIDFTMFGRKLLVGSEEVPLAVLKPLNSSHCESESWTKDGSQMATQVIVSGGTDSDNNHYIGRYPDISQVDSKYGLIQRRFHETSILDDASVRVAAATRYHLLKPVPLFGTVDLRPDAPYCLNDIVAGAEVTYSGDSDPDCDEADRNHISGRYRVSSVDMSLLREGEEGESRMTLNLQPVGTISGQLTGEQSSSTIPGT